MTQRDDLVSRLKAVDQGSVEDCFLQSPLFTYAATALEMKDAEIAKLRACGRTAVDAGEVMIGTLRGELQAAESRIAELERQLAEKEK